MPALPLHRAPLYPRAPWYFALAIVVTWVGFSTSYFGRLAQTDLYHHLHGATAGAWLALLIAQPILYQQGRLALHRKLGKVAALVLVPLLVAGGFKLMHTMLRHPAAYPPGATYQLAYIDLCSLGLFLLFFGLSIGYGKRLARHARYMVCTVLIIMPPAITRLLFLLPWFDSFAKTLNGSFVVTELILLLLLADDRRTGRLHSPYVVALVLFGLLHLTLNLCPGWSWWHRTADWFSALSL